MKPSVLFQTLLLSATWLSVSLAAQDVTLNPVADAHVRSGTNQNTNFGTAATLEIKQSASPTDNFNREIYLKFDLGSVSSVRTAKLRLYASAGSPEIVTSDLYSAANTAWTESGITWANKPATGPVIWSTLALQNAPAWHEWDISRFLQGEKTMGRNLVTLVLKNFNPSTTGAIGFNSLQNASNRPELVITPAFPWTYYEAEAGTKHADATLEAGTSWGQVAFEARGKKTVTLDAAGEYVQWTGVKASTHATVRYSIADGQTGTLALYVDGVKKADLPLTSERMRETKTGAAAPPSQTVRYFDDALVAVPGGIPAGATVKLQKDVTGSVAYVIDFLELETAPAVGTKPDNSWVTVVQNTGNDRAAIVAAITAANAGSRKVWIPAGNYVVNLPLPGERNPTGAGIEVPAGVEIRGAGMWHTAITKNYGGNNRRLFTLVGNNTVMRDFKGIDTITTLTDNGQNVIVRANDNTSGHLVEGIWGEYASLYLGFHVSNSTIRGNRVRNAYKDTIHLARTSSNNLVELNSIRNAGDDNVALVAYENTGMVNNTVQYNVSECGYWGRGFTNLGGDGNIIRYNLVNDATRAGILVMIETYAGQTTQYCTNWVVEMNVIVRCGNDLPLNNNTSGALGIEDKIDASPVSGRMEHNLVLAPPFNGSILSQFVGDAGTGYGVSFRANAIEAPAIGDSSYGRKKTTGLSANSNVVDTPNTDL